MQMQSNTKEISGYSYIDEAIKELLEFLPEEDVARYSKTFKSLYLAGITEGLRRQIIQNNFNKNATKEMSNK